MPQNIRQMLQVNGDIQQDQNEFLDKQGNKMEDEGAKREFKKFREDALEQRGNNTISDQNERIKNVVNYMDAEMVFKMVSITGSTVQFSNGKTLDLCFNSQFDIHPRAINQMNQIRQNKTDNNKTDLQNMMELTKKYPTVQKTDETEYLKKIRDCLKPYEMITRKEIEIVKEMINSRITGPLAEHYRENMTRSDAYRLRTVLDGAPQNGLQLAYRLAISYDGDMTTRRDDDFTDILAAWVEIVKHECHGFKMPDSVPVTPHGWINYYREQGIPDEIVGMMNNGMTKEEATDRANENFAKRERVEQARINEATPEELKYIAMNNKVENDRLMRSYHQKTYQEWLIGGNKKEKKEKMEKFFFQEFDDNFDAKLETYRKEIERIKEYDKKEAPTFTNPVAAYYHVRKHGSDSLTYFKNNYHYDIILNMPSNTMTEEYNYFTTEKNFLFMDQKYKQKKYVSQDATKTSTIYRDGKCYFGVTKCSYDAVLGRKKGMHTVATHYQEKK